MKIDKTKKAKLKSLLDVLSTPSEKQELQRLDASKVKEIVTLYKEELEETESNYNSLLAAMNKYIVASHKHSREVVETFNNFSEEFAKNLEAVAGKITTSYEKNKPFNAAGVYKDMINQLSAVNQSIKDKPNPVWNWPQYASVGVRNSSFKNIDPATDGLGIGSYDYVSLAQTSTVDAYSFKTGGASGTLVATVTINYTDSTKATISNVART